MWCAKSWVQCAGERWETGGDSGLGTEQGGADLGMAVWLCGESTPVSNSHMHHQPEFMWLAFFQSLSCHQTRLLLSGIVHLLFYQGNSIFKTHFVFSCPQWIQRNLLF